MDRACPRFFALTSETTLMDVKRMILEKLRGIFNEAPETDEQLNNMVEVHVRDNLPMIQRGKYSWDKTRANCEFCGQKHTYKEEHCELKIDGVIANESIENASNVTIG